MKKRPIQIIIVSILFILVGVAGFASHVKELSDKLYETIWVLFVEVLAVTCGILLLSKIGWARWLAIAWLIYHVIISAFNSTSEMIAHIVFLVGVSVLLFLPVSSTYFLSESKHLKKKTLKLHNDFISNLDIKPPLKIKLPPTTALLKAWLDGSDISNSNAISQYPARRNTIELLFLSSTFIFQFGFSYGLTGMLIPRLQQC